jgi:hypothetical protein
MLGSRLGSKAGSILGSKVGSVADDESASAVTWDVDATSGIAVPSSTSQWDAFIAANSLAISAPDSIYLCQEAAGNLADSAGAFPLTASGTVGYRAAAAGWSRVGVSTTNGMLGRFLTTDAALPDISTTSMMTLFFAVASAASSNKVICRFGTTAAALLINSTTPNRFRVVSNAGSAVSAAFDPSGAVRPYVLRERADLATTVGATDQEKLTPAHGLVTGKKFVLGDDAAAAASAVYVYAVRWDGAKANAFSDAVLKSTLQAMGCTIPWS